MSTEIKSKKYKLKCKCGTTQYTDDYNLQSNINCPLKDYEGKCEYTIKEVVEKRGDPELTHDAYMKSPSRPKPKRWTGIHYYHPPKYTNKLLVIGLFGKLWHIGGKHK